MYREKPSTRGESRAQSMFQKVEGGWVSRKQKLIRRENSPQIPSFLVFARGRGIPAQESQAGRRERQDRFRWAKTKEE